MGKAIKGLFSRAKSPEGKDQTARSRLRSMVGEKRTRPATSGGPSRLDVLGFGQSTITREPDEKRLRPPSPEFGRSKRNIRFAPSALPVMQKGTDGKWQPPSLARGSLSTSALALYAQGEDVDMADASGKAVHEPQDGKEWAMTHGIALAGVFGGSFVGRGKDQDRSIQWQEDGPRAGGGGEDTIRPIGAILREDSPIGVGLLEESLPAAAIAERPKSSHVESTSGSAPRFPHPPAGRVCASPDRAVPSHDAGAVAGAARRVRSPTAPPSTHTQAQIVHSPRPLPSHSRSISEPLLSKDHFTIRLSTSYLLKCLTPIIRGSAFVQNDKNVEMRRLADDRLSQLERMERGWGGEWGRVAVGALEESESGEGLEGKVRAVQVGERTKERERKIWKEALRDGVLLCL